MERNILMWLINVGWSEQIAAAIAEAFPSGSLEHGTRGKHSWGGKYFNDMAVEEGPIRSERKQKETKIMQRDLIAKGEDYEDKKNKRKEKGLVP